ncbi:MAG: hypothetical protein ACRDH9_11080 [Actinomycetota bacterium]
METRLESRRGDTLIRLLLVLPSLVWVVANVLKFEMGVDAPYDFLRPVIGPGTELAEMAVAAVVILGPLAAILLTLLRTTRISLTRTKGGVRARGSLSARWGDIAILGFAAASLVVIGFYVIAEFSGSE